MDYLWTPVDTAKEWVDLCPANEELSYERSTRFIKRLVYSTFSTVAYARNMFKEKVFIPSTLFGYKTHLIRKNSGDMKADFLINAIKTSFEAFDNKQVHAIEICVFDEDHTKLESYGFVIHYLGYGHILNQGDVIMQASNEEKYKGVREAVQNMLKISQESAEMEPPLPDHINLELLLHYNINGPVEFGVAHFTTCHVEGPTPGVQVLAPTMRPQALVRTHSHGVILQKTSALVVPDLESSLSSSTIPEQSPRTPKPAPTSGSAYTPQTPNAPAPGPAYSPHTPNAPVQAFGYSPYFPNGPAAAFGYSPYIPTAPAPAFAYSPHTPTAPAPGTAPAKKVRPMEMEELPLRSSFKRRLFEPEQLDIKKKRYSE